jgi:hypothetical protein
MAKTAAQLKAEDDAFRLKQVELNSQPLATPDSLLSQQENLINTRKGQVASDLAHQNEPVMLRDPNLPPEAQAFASPYLTQSVPGRAPSGQGKGTEFVDPNAPAQTASTPGAPPVQAPVQSPVATTGQTLGIPDQTNAMNNAYSAHEKAAADAQAQIDKVNADRDAAIQQRMEQDDQEVEQIKPADIFAGKSTWQKILGGVGMFLGSITPEGAKNVANIIDKEIDRDQQLQLNNIKHKKDKQDRHYQNLLQKYGSQEAALLAKKRDAYTVLGLQINKLQAASQSAESRAKLEMAKEEIGLKRQELGVKQWAATQKAMQEAAKYSVPNYEGAPLDPASKKAFNDTLISADTLHSTLNELSDLVKGTGESIPYTQKNDRAIQLVGDVQLQLKELKKLGVLSGDDAKRLDYYISNPSLFKSDARMQENIKGVQDLVNKTVSAYETRFGQKRKLPEGAEKIK